MIQEADLTYFKDWFEVYTKQFCTGVERIDSAISLKVKHTKDVVREILDIAYPLQLDAEHHFPAEVVAILLDIGRFEQYIRYHTYSDQSSEDHAKLGLEVMSRTGVINRLSKDEQELVRNVVVHHNQASLPNSDNEKFLLILKLLRDADKISILQAVTEHYAGLFIMPNSLESIWQQQTHSFFPMDIMITQEASSR